MSTHHLRTDASRAESYHVIEVSSPAFADQGMIPVVYTCEGRDISPPLDFKHIPNEAVTLALIMDDPDAPGKTWVHWVLWNIPVTHHIKENEVHGEQGMNDFGRKSYGGPCPPSGTHRYFFKVYALSCTLNLPAETTKHTLEKAMAGHILGYGELIGLYKRQQK
ncbi:MAG TPA: YbhB/YbcL family Raf kinase inhibitor-like protein [Chitinophagaceae bacterium]|nr:YbhB/YbcL family Raf kinase inhibitor-like protein [Chitinophagaceae bacterium]HRF26305.1 YbhB/YbcL family Raf kinase inhibitor-like protein [Ferruginibacter sp.]